MGRRLFWKSAYVGEGMRDNGNLRLRLSVCTGDPETDNRSLTGSRTRAQTSLGQATGAALSRGSSQTDTCCNAVDTGESFCPEEQQIVALVMTGYSNKEIALQFSVCESTIYRRIDRLSRKLGVHNKLELLLFAISRQCCVAGRL